MRLDPMIPCQPPWPNKPPHDARQQIEAWASRLARQLCDEEEHAEAKTICANDLPPGPLVVPTP